MARTPARPRKASKPVQKRAQVSERSESGDDELDSDFEPEVAEQLHDVEDEATWDGLSGVDGKPVAVFLFKIANSMRKKLVAQIEVRRLILVHGLLLTFPLQFLRISVVWRLCLQRRLTYSLPPNLLRSSEPSSEPPVQCSDAWIGLNDYGMNDTSKKK